MRANEADILIIPGLGNSGPDHWQSRWEAKLPTARRIIQKDWERPQLEDWRKRIVAEVAAAEKPVVLVAHSLGAVAVAHAAAELEGKVRGAFLVAPPSPRIIAGLDPIDPDFADIPMAPLPFPAVLVASHDDTYAHYAETEELARAWRAEIADAGASGHINAESGHGPWPEGLMRFVGFLKKL
ncbi:MAG TPA: alpha/beta fold hydrolase [Methylovirgula sp.]|nr:alpha/beta fold hydrolase [Methylovirgula sp.]